MLAQAILLKAVDDYQDLLRISVATAGNDHRLGANEAPPAVVSLFLGDELSAVLEAIENDTPYEGTKKTQMKLGADVLPKFNRDTTDRNRTDLISASVKTPWEVSISTFFLSRIWGTASAVVR